MERPAPLNNEPLPCQSNSAIQGEEEELDIEELGQRIEQAKPEVAAVKIILRNGARLLKPTLIYLERSSSRPAARRDLELQVGTHREPDLGRLPFLANLRFKGLQLTSPLVVVHATLNRLWDGEEAATRARILKRARRRSIECKRNSTIAISSALLNMDRRSCTAIEVNWFAAKGRIDHPLMQVGSDSEFSQQERRRTLQTINELSSRTTSIECHGKATEENSVVESEGGTAYHRKGGKSEQLGDMPTILITDADTHPLKSSLSTPIDREKDGHTSLSGAKIFDLDGLPKAYPLRIRSPRLEREALPERTGGPRIAPRYRSRYLDLSDPGRVPPGAHLPAKFRNPMGRTMSYGDVQHRNGNGFNMRENTRAEPSARWKRQSLNTLGSPSMLPYSASIPSGMPSSNQIADPAELHELLRGSRPMMASETSLDDLADDATDSDRDPVVRPRPARYHSRLPPSSAPIHSHALARYSSNAGSKDRRSGPIIPFRRSMARTSSINSTVTSKVDHHENEPVEISSKNPLPSPSSPKKTKSLNRNRHEALAALTAPASPPVAKMTPECLALLEAQQKELDVKIRRASIAYVEASRQSFSHDDNKSKSAAPDQSIGARMENQEIIFEKLTHPDAQKSLLREQQKLLRWNAAREKVEFERRQQENKGAEISTEKEVRASADSETRPSKRNTLLCGLF